MLFLVDFRTSLTISLFLGETNRKLTNFEGSGFLKFDLDVGVFVVLYGGNVRIFDETLLQNRFANF